MQTPLLDKVPKSRGLKNAEFIEKDPANTEPSLFRPSTYKDMPSRDTKQFPFRVTASGFWQNLFFAPFNNPESPSYLNGAGVLLLCFLGALVNGWVVHAAYRSAAVAAENVFLRGTHMAFVSAAVFLVTQYWTYEGLLKTYVYPEFALASIGTSTVGIFVALLQCVAIFGGYASAGAILVGLYNTDNRVINIAVSDESYALYWLGATLITFSWIFNANFRQTSLEKLTKAHYRAAIATALAIFAVTVAFFPSGFFTFSSGHYLTAVIFAGDNAQGPPGVVAWAFYVFVPLLASTAAAIILYVIFMFLFSDTLSNYPGIGKAYTPKYQ